MTPPARSEIEGGPPTDGVYGDTRQLYNEVFLPKMEKYLESVGEGAESAEGSPASGDGEGDDGPQPPPQPGVQATQDCAPCTQKSESERVRRLPLKSLTLADMNAKPASKAAAKT